ncbi:MAG: carboxypeptidase-like regulatory domain-containing protein, partial [Bryobacteraceae bacterium]
MKPLRVSTLSVTGLLLLLSVSPVIAQKYRAQVRGLVIDQTGAALPGAAVTLLNPSTGIKAIKETDNSGLYVFDYVDPGA